MGGEGGGDEGYGECVKDWNVISLSILSSAEASENSVSRFITLVRCRHYINKYMYAIFPHNV